MTAKNASLRLYFFIKIIIKNIVHKHICPGKVKESTKNFHSAGKNCVPDRLKK